MLSGQEKTHKVLLFGDPLLETKCALVNQFNDELFNDIKNLNNALLAFQSKYGWGRAMSAPQIGITKRLIVVNEPSLPKVIINPEVIWSSGTVQTIWDDCMSLPEIAVKVQRHTSISVRYQSQDGTSSTLERLLPDQSELLQHEIDHLDGILMDKRMIQPNAIISRSKLPSCE